MKILFCLASGNSPQNINPLLEIKPDKVVVGITQTMKNNHKANTLLNEIKNSGYKTEEFFIDNEASLTALNDQFSSFIENHIDNELIANITGGTKLMSIALYQSFNTWGFRSFYCDIDSNQLIWLDDESAISNIGSKIGLVQYLRSYQFHIDNKIALANINKTHKDYAKFMHEELCRFGQFDTVARMISKLNAHTSEKKLKDNELQNFRFDKDELVILRKLSHNFGLFEVKNGLIVCENERDRRFVNGEWLEVLVANCLCGADFRDISQSVKISKSTQRKNNQARNEIDVMAMRQDKLYIVECKTINWKKHKSEASNAIYKLSSLSDIGGLNTFPIFVSLYDLPAAAKTRAAEMGVQLLCGKDDIVQLKQKLHNR